MIKQKKSPLGQLATGAAQLVAWCIVSGQAQGASLTTPERPVPNLSEAVVDLAARLEKSQQERQDLLDKLEQIRREGITELQGIFDPSTSAPSIAWEAVATLSQQLAQAEIWQAALLAGSNTASEASESGELPFSARDNLVWYAVLLDAAGQRPVATSISDHAKMPTETTELVASVLNAGDTQRTDLFADLESRLQNFPREPAAALAVETILRRKVGPEELRNQLMATSTALSELTSGSLRMYLDSVVRAERRSALQKLVGKSEFHVVGMLPDGAAFDSRSLTGKVVVVAFWAPESAKCLVELPRLVKLHQSYSAGLEIVAVTSVRGANKVQEFLDRHPEVTWPQLIDAGAAQQGALHPLAKEAGVASFPTFFVIDGEGVLRSINAASELESLTASLLEGR